MIEQAVAAAAGLAAFLALLGGVAAIMLVSMLAGMTLATRREEEPAPLKAIGRAAVRTRPDDGSWT